MYVSVVLLVLAANIVVITRYIIKSVSDLFFDLATLTPSPHSGKLSNLCKNKADYGHDSLVHLASTDLSTELSTQLTQSGVRANMHCVVMVNKARSNCNYLLCSGIRLSVFMRIV